MEFSRTAISAVSTSAGAYLELAHYDYAASGEYSILYFFEFNCAVDRSSSYCLASLTQGLTLSVPDNTYTGDAPVCTWMANDSDPSSFTLVLAMAPQGINPVKSIANAVERNGKSSGSQSFPAVVMAGYESRYRRDIHSSALALTILVLFLQVRNQAFTYYSGGRILAMIQFQVTDPLITVRDQTSIAGSVTNTPHSAIAATSQITGNGAPSSQDGPAISDALGGTVSMRSLKSDAAAGITITTDITIDSRTRSGPTALPSDISLRSKRQSKLYPEIRINIGGLVGGIIAGVHRHTLTHPSVTVYDIAEDLDVQRQKRHWNIKQKATHGTKTAPSSHPVVMQRQQGLQNRAAEIDRELEESHSALRNLPDASPEFTRTLITEIERLNQENQHLRDLTRSDWALGVTNIPPPSYPHSETSSS
ncbi:hypothetical protein C8J56DRAFT_889605 [Mycena floridula]|nr:hypothetical protein C8J56DRAFT_889605 [Mycena floridula]